jgi:hypothetical protein
MRDIALIGRCTVGSMENRDDARPLRRWDSVPNGVALTEHKDFLIRVLEPGAWHLRRDVVVLAEREGLRAGKLGLARKALGIETVQAGDPDGLQKRASFWRIPKEAR